MIDAIQVAALDAAANPAAAPAVQPQASAIEVRDFAQALERTGATAQAQQPAAANAVAGPVQAEPSATTRMMVDAFDNLNGSAKSIESLSMRLAGGTEMTPSQMLEMTMQCHQFMFQSQLTSNVANRTSDGVQQLFRQQS
ncbi:MAG: hypothetical protein LCH70_11290 [Proteobacteria bacterium]|nr:hypothetical protein [Pseudomonadota bacterium]